MLKPTLRAVLLRAVTIALALAATLLGLQRKKSEAMHDFRVSEAMGLVTEMLRIDPGTPTYHVGYLTGLVLYRVSDEDLERFFSEVIDVRACDLDPAERRKLLYQCYASSNPIAWC